MMGTIWTSIPVCPRPFPLPGSTGSKQTLNGLFICDQDFGIKPMLRIIPPGMFRFSALLSSCEG
jgi:hypothetical protein